MTASSRACDARVRSVARKPRHGERRLRARDTRARERLAKRRACQCGAFTAAQSCEGGGGVLRGSGHLASRFLSRMPPTPAWPRGTAAKARGTWRDLYRAVGVRNPSTGPRVLHAGNQMTARTPHPSRCSAAPRHRPKRGEGSVAPSRALLPLPPGTSSATLALRSRREFLGYRLQTAQ